MDIRFTQSTASPNFSKGGTVNDTIQGLRTGKVTPQDIPTIRVVEHNGKLYTLDNRRLVAFQNAGVKEIPIRRVSLRDLSARFAEVAEVAIYRDPRPLFFRLRPDQACLKTQDSGLRNSSGGE